MNKKQHSDDLCAEDSEKVIKFPDGADKENDTFDDDYVIDDVMVAEEEKFYQELRTAMKTEIQMYAQRGREKEPHQFSEHYETRLRENLSKLYGEENAEQILEYRRQTKEQMAAETAAKLTPPESIEPAEGKKKHKYADWYRKTRFKGIVACMGIVIIGSVVTMNVDALRVPIARFFSEEKAEYTVLRVESDTESDIGEETYPDAIEKKFVLSKILEGYEEVDSFEFEKHVQRTYSNSKGEIYQFIQETKDVDLWADNEDVLTEKYDTIFGDAFYFEKDLEYHLVWQYEGYIFHIAGNLTEEEMIDLANSLKLEK